MTRTIEKEVTIGTDMSEGRKWEEEILDVYNGKNEAYEVFQLARHVRELAKNVIDGTYYVKDMDVLRFLLF